MNDILREDLETILNCEYIHWDHYKNCTFLVTGATGLIGSLVVRTLSYISDRRELNIRILILVRNTEKVKQVFGPDFNPSGIC